MKSKQAEMKDILYIKRGKRYIPCSDPWATDGLRAGHWHVWVREGSVTMRQPVWPDNMGLESAMYEAQEGMLKLIRERSQPTASRKLTRKEKAAYKAWRDIIGEESMFQLWGCSAQELVNAAFEAIRPKKEETPQ